LHNTALLAEAEKMQNSENRILNKKGKNEEKQGFL